MIIFWHLLLTPLADWNYWRLIFGKIFPGLSLWLTFEIRLLKDSFALLKPLWVKILDGRLVLLVSFVLVVADRSS